VTVVANTQVYVGTAGPQPAGDLGSRYAGGATQYFFADDSISTNTAILFSDATSITELAVQGVGVAHLGVKLVAEVDLTVLRCSCRRRC
jgi:hypothetical protein